MNRTVVSGLAAFALLIGAALAMNETAEAGHCGGGLFARLHAKKCGGGLLGGHGCGGGLFAHKKCGGGLFARLKARHAAKNCCAPEPVCCEPAPEPCCEPAPAPCCEPAPEPCCEPAPAPCCGGEAAAPAPCEGCSGGATVSSEGFDLAPGETLVPGSVMTVEPAAEGGELAAPESASDAAEEAAPPAPEPDTNADK